MLVQHTDKNIVVDAVELDIDATQQAWENITQSPQIHRVSVHTEDTQQWILHQTVHSDLIISNPPYYERGVECATPQREQARCTISLGRQALFTLTADSIMKEGFFCIVLPEQTGDAFIQQALNMGWHLRLRTDVTETGAWLPHRVLLAFSPQVGECFSDRLAVRRSD